MLLDSKHNCHFWSKWLITQHIKFPMNYTLIHCITSSSCPEYINLVLPPFGLLDFATHTSQFKYCFNKEQFLLRKKWKKAFLSLGKGKWSFLTRYSSAKTERISWEWRILSTQKSHIYSFRPFSLPNINILQLMPLVWEFRIRKKKKEWNNSL